MRIRSLRLFLCGLVLSWTSSLHATEIVAHRGASADAPENTLASVELAWRLGSDAVEIDVRLTADEQVVVIHDDKVDRTTDGSGKVASMTLRELRHLDAGSWKGAEHVGVGLPTLDEVLQTIPEGKRLFVEVKSDISILPYLEASFRRAEISPKQIVLIAFDLETCRQFKKRNPEFEVCLLRKIRRRLLVGPWTPGVKKMLRLVREAGLDGLDVKAVEAVDASLIRAIKSAGFKLYVYTVDDLDRAGELIRLGLDGLTTNRPADMKQLRDGLD